MKIAIINGSPRENGSTGKMLNIIKEYLESKPNVEIKYIYLYDMKVNTCKGCCHCFKSGKCFIDDAGEILSNILKDADGIIIGTPTYASNIPGHLKTFVDRGHLIIEQLLYRKYAMGIVTGENYGASSASKILKNIFKFSGAFVSSQLKFKLPFSNNPNINQVREKLLIKKAEHLYMDIERKRTYLFQKMVHKVIFHIGIKPFVLKKGEEYQGVLEHWKDRGCYN